MTAPKKIECPKCGGTGTLPEAVDVVPGSRPPPDKTRVCPRCNGLRWIDEASAAGLN